MSKSMIGGQVVLPGGKSYKIVDETNTHWICKGTQFLKNNPGIAEILPPEEPKKIERKSKKKEEPDREE